MRAEACDALTFHQLEEPFTVARDGEGLVVGRGGEGADDGDWVQVGGLAAEMVSVCSLGESSLAPEAIQVAMASI